MLGFNVAAGLPTQDDKLPDLFTVKKLSPTIQCLLSQMRHWIRFAVFSITAKDLDQNCISNIFGNIIYIL